MKKDEITKGVSFGRYLLNDTERTLPHIYTDNDTRRELGLVPGQTVWVRREPNALFRAALNRSASAVMLVYGSVVLTVRDLWRDCGIPEGLEAIPWIVMGVILIMLIRYFYSAMRAEIRVEVRSD